MQKILLSLTASLLSAACMSVAHADYSSSGNNYPPTAPDTVVSSSYESSHHQRKHGMFSSQSSEAPAYQSHQHSQPFWVAMSTGEPIPTDAVVGGMQHHPNTMLYVCRANYRGGVHPGKYSGGSCNISWGGREKSMQRFEILVSESQLEWVRSNGNLPRHSVIGGQENHRKLYICQAEYNNGTLPGKIVGRNCNIAWGGREVTMPNYKVLTS